MNEPSTEKTQHHAVDDDKLAALGHRAELQRNFSTLYACVVKKKKKRQELLILTYFTTDPC